MRERERGKTCKRNREGYIYTEREREKRDKERLGDRERESTHAYVHECVNMFVCMFVHTQACIHIPPRAASSSNLDSERSRAQQLERSIDQ